MLNRIKNIKGGAALPVGKGSAVFTRAILSGVTLFAFFSILFFSSPLQAQAAACTNDTASSCALETGRITDDPDFTPANIKSGVNILGVTGTFSGPSGPPDCPNIGDLCADGTVFAGWVDAVTYAPAFIPPTDQQNPDNAGVYTMYWKDSVGTNDIDYSSQSTSDGRINRTGLLGSINDFEAFRACDNLTFASHSDWYLPSQDELNYIWTVLGTIEAAGHITNFQSANYWTSTQNGNSNAYYQSFTDGTEGSDYKTTAYYVRCIRR